MTNSIFSFIKMPASSFFLTAFIALLSTFLWLNSSYNIGEAQVNDENSIFLPFIISNQAEEPPTEEPPTEEPPTEEPPIELKLTVSKKNTEIRAVEGDSEGVVYTIERSNSSSSITFPISMIEGTAERIAFDSQTYIKNNPEPSSEFYFSDDQYFCAIGDLKQAGTTALAAGSTNDYTIADEDGTILTDSISFLDGETSKEIIIRAVLDTHTEVPEKVEFDILPAEGYSVVEEDPFEVLLVEGVDEVVDNSLLFVGQMVAEENAQTTASGLVTVRLAKDNSFALVSMSFNGLTSEQTAAHIHIANPVSGPVIFSLPMGQFSDVKWDVKAAQFISTDQGMLDTLLAGGLYANVHTANYPAGEIKGILTQKDGQQDPIFNYPPPEYENLTGDELRQDIFRFLSQATFGATPELVAKMEQRIANNGGDRITAYNEWINEQLLMEAPSHQEYWTAARKSYVHGVAEQDLDDALFQKIGRKQPFHGGWLLGATYGKAQLRERTSFALNEILVTSPGTSDYYLVGTVSYNDMLKKHAFDDFSTLLYHVSRHPLMGVWLSHFQNQKTTYDNDGNIIASPDENYAREIMQLFSIGLLELHPDGTLKLGEDGLPIETYTQGDITELARAFTGWGKRYKVDYDTYPDRLTPHPQIPNDNFTGNLGSTRRYIYSPSQDSPMMQFDQYHDDGSKEILGFDFPAGQDGEQELIRITEILEKHPNSGPFLAYRMIQRLTTSNPSPGYVYRVTRAFEKSDHNMGEMVRAILLDPEARNLQPIQAAEAGRVQEPLIQWITLCRFMTCTTDVADTYTLSALSEFGLSSNQLDLYEDDAQRFFIKQDIFVKDTMISQAPFMAPSVFNWFMPDFAPTGPISEAGLTAPELQHITESIAINYYNLITASTLKLGNNLGNYPPRHKSPDPEFQTLSPPTMIDAYMSVMDTNGNNQIDSNDGTMNDPAKIREASSALIDIADLYLCDGWLAKDATGNPLTDPREIMITGVVNIHQQYDNNNESDANKAIDLRIRDTLLFTMVAPQCYIQR